MKRWIFILLAGIALIYSCGDPHEVTVFSNTDAVRLEVAGITRLVYDPFSCQMAFNRERGEFRVHTDSMSDYFIVKLSEIPTETGSEVIGDVIWTTNSEVVYRNNITLRLINSQGDKLWFWNANYRIGVEVRILE